MNEVKRSILLGMQILNNGKWENDQAVVIEENKIKSIIPAAMIEHHMPATKYDFPPDYYLMPGLIDLHIHGAHGKDVMDASEEALQTISRALAAEGITGYLATTMTASKDAIEAVLNVVPKAMQDPEGAAILGIHLEGPFIAKAKMGAQRGEDIQLPDADLMRHWQKLADHTIKIVTLAPELPDAMKLIKALVDMGVIASIGHTNANYAETCAAIDAGCKQATHLFNAMSGIHQREPGAVTALLLAKEVSVEMIVDGLHLSPPIVELIWQLKNKDRLLLVTDAMRAKCLANGSYDLGGQTVEVRDGRVMLENGVLAGSTLRMPEAIKNMVAFSKCTLIDAVTMASTNPAHVLGLSASKGAIDVGKDADLVVSDAELNVVLTMRDGRIIFQR